MALQIASLNSGSNGNCYYMGNDSEAVLIDVGISCLEVEKRMKRLNLALDKIKAIFVSHEHNDHIIGVQTLSRKYQLPVFITEKTLYNSNLSIPTELVFAFEAYSPISMGALTITAFPKYHDAVDPHNFIVANETVKVGVFTDLGFPCRHTIHHFRQCHAAFLETNYDTDMLETGPYPYALKNRIRGGEGHLSNAQAAKLFTEHRSARLSHLILSHLSRTNNKPTLVESLFKPLSGTTNVVVASRKKESKLYSVTGREESMDSPAPYTIDHYKQLELF